MNKKLDQLRREVEKRGGIIGFTPEIPDEIAEMLLKDVLACPDCEAIAKSPSIDQVLETEAPYWRRRGH